MKVAIYTTLYNLSCPKRISRELWLLCDRVRQQKPAGMASVVNQKKNGYF